jgi:single-stranded-DNA-specific exonuclease
LIQAHKKLEKVCVWGDFDVDGQTSTALLVDVLRRCNFNVSYHIPNRERESHGVNREYLEKIIDDGSHLILTCDTGIGAKEAVSYATSRGVDVVITDHHDLPDRLPDASALVNPKLLPEGHGLRELPGVGVAYLVARHLCDKLGTGIDLSSDLDLVALGIVADLARQVNDVRYLLQLGLRQLQRTERVGLKALMVVSNLQQSEITEEQIGFMIGPRMNALGRLADANPAVEFLLTANIEAATQFAHKLEALNAKRKQLSDAVYDSAKRMLNRNRKLLDNSAIVLESVEWPAGVVGIVAGRMVEDYRKPVILMTLSEDGVARGSARSVQGVDISKVIASQSALLEGFGGHPMAAGLAIQRDRIQTFRREVDKYIKQHYPEPLEEPVVQIDAYLPIESLKLELVADLERLSPFGPGNPPLVLAARGLKIIGTRTIGKNDDHLLVRIRNLKGIENQVIWWNGSGRELPRGQFDLAYQARTSNYRGVETVQVEWIAARPHIAPAIAVSESRLKVEDHRFHTHPRAVLDDLVSADKVVWAEGREELGLVHSNRYDIRPCEELIVWTAPPDLPTFRSTILQASPQKIHIFLRVPDPASPKDFLHLLTGMAKFALEKKDGRFDIQAAAVALAQTEAVIEMGLERLADLEIIDLAQRRSEEFLLKRSTLHGKVELSANHQLQVLLGETASFRALIRKVDQAWFSKLLQ